jgi:formylglycine-generating enzyme required for sulfatase activity
VTGGTFNRDNNASYPATLSDFALDKFEITVGRFRAFVDAGFGTKSTPPSSGSGGHPTILDSGWKATWNNQLPIDKADLLTQIKCAGGDGPPSWTDSPGANENLPLVCLSWYLAFAFCDWDAGRLPTEAEWDYAAAGGSEQRIYPWSVPPNSTLIAGTDANYRGACGACTPALLPVGQKQAGNGRWGHSDLSGNVWEIVLDWYDTYATPCNDCANLTAPASMPERALRGGGFGEDQMHVYSYFRSAADPTWYRVTNGARCARLP